MRDFWKGFEKRATASGAKYHRDQSDTINTIQEDNYPPGPYPFFNPAKGPTVNGAVFFDDSADAVDLSAGGYSSRHNPSVYTMGYEAHQ